MKTFATAKVFFTFLILKHIKIKKTLEKLHKKLKI